MIRSFTRGPGRRTWLAFVSLGLLATAGCSRLDPLERPYMWHATDINRQNITAMAINPKDLTHGRGTDRRMAKPDTDSVDRYLSDKTKSLTSGGSGGGGAAPAAGGG
jgi:hypothetical protein